MLPVPSTIQTVLSQMVEQSRQEVILVNCSNGEQSNEYSVTYLPIQFKEYFTLSILLTVSRLYTWIFTPDFSGKGLGWAPGSRIWPRIVSEHQSGILFSGPGSGGGWWPGGISTHFNEISPQPPSPREPSDPNRNHPQTFHREIKL